MKAQVASLEKQNADYMTRLNKMKQLETDNTTLAQSKEDLEKRLELLMQTSKDLSKQAEKAKKLEKANEALEIEHDDLSAELSQLKKKLGELDELKAENLKLKESFKNSSGDGSAHEEELQGLQASLDQWKGLAEVYMLEHWTEY